MATAGSRCKRRVELPETDRHPVSVRWSLQPVWGTGEAFLQWVFQCSPDILEKNEMVWVPFELWAHSFLRAGREFYYLCRPLRMFRSQFSLALSALIHFNFPMYLLMGLLLRPVLHCAALPDACDGRLP